MGIALTGAPAAAFAGGGAKVISAEAPKDDVLRLTPNKDRILRLEQDAASVIVNNPAHATVLMDSPRLLIVQPHAPGATSFTVLDGAGKTIMHKEVIVTGVQPKYVRIRRMCNSNDGGCVPSAYYYCPDGCYEVNPVDDAQSAGNIPPPPATPASSSSSATGDAPPALDNPVGLSTQPALPLGMTSP